MREILLRETPVEAVKDDRKVFWFSLQVEHAAVVSPPQVSKKITKNKTSNPCFSPLR